MKHILLCADDYGQNQSISQAIIELAEKNRLSATSCMTNSEEWLDHAKWLIPLKNRIQIGLHINLTDGKPLSAAFKKFYGAKMLSLPELLIRGCVHRLDKHVIEQEISSQLDRFIEGMGCLPNFIDGHQHVHHFPQIREIILRLYEKRLRIQNCRIRSVYDSQAIYRYREGAYVKRLIIQFSGAITLKKQLVDYHIPHNTSFSGIYDFAKAKNYSEIFPQFLKEITDGGLIMCHPGLQADVGPDPIYGARSEEYQYFLSDKFLRDCEAQQVSIGRDAKFDEHGWVLLS